MQQYMGHKAGLAKQIIGKYAHLLGDKVTKICLNEVDFFP